MAPAFAFASGVSPRALAHLPPDTELSITARPRGDLAALQSRLDDEGPFFDVDEIEPLSEADSSGSRSGSLFDDHDLDADYGDYPGDFRPEHEALSRGSEADQHRAEVLARHDTSIMHANRIGIHRTPRHHLLPQEHIDFFEERGLNIHDWCIETTTTEHGIIHSKGRDWSKILMARLEAEEAIFKIESGDPLAKLPASEVISIMKRLMVQFDLNPNVIVEYE